MSTAATTADTPFHEGEIAIQERYGVAERMRAFASRIVRDHLPDQHRDFLSELPFVVLGTVDREGRVWASILDGAPGFVGTPDARTIRIAAEPRAGDPLGAALRAGAPVGGLGIQFESRRRNRFTARVRALGDGAVTLGVEQTFGNCPQYIHSRRPARFVDTPAGAPERFDGLDAEARETIARADTFFVASVAPADSPEAEADPRRGADVSHRGGKPGFVRVADDGTLTIPDFAGNLHFNTFGNLALDPRAGLVFAEWETGDLLFLTGTATVVFDDPEIRSFRGAERIWRFWPSEGVRIRAALRVRFEAGEQSPNSLLTGDWDEAAKRREAEARRAEWRPFRVAKIVEESTTIRSLHLEPADGGGVPAFEAGQFLPVRLEVPGEGRLSRTYTVSSAPGDRFLRISVKREGRVSGAIHALGDGAVIEAQAPRGAFTLDAAETRPAVLLSAGVGITPMIAMLRHALLEGARTRHTRPVWFVHSARTKAERAFFDEALALSARSEALRTFWLLSRPEAEAQEGRDHDLAGRLDVGVLKRLLPFDDHDFYLCGPEGFVQGLYDGLRDLGVRDARIFAESFGPSALERRPDGPAPARPEATGAAEVAFAASGVTAEWTPEKGTLLELAESAGLSPASQCRSGQCGTCAVKLKAGRVKYLGVPTAPVAEGEVLTCCSVPDAEAGGPKARIALDL